MWVITALVISVLPFLSSAEARAVVKLNSLDGVMLFSLHLVHSQGNYIFIKLFLLGVSYRHGGKKTFHTCTN